MEKIISLFKRDYEGTRQIYDEIVPGAEWVVNGEGVATVKWDGTSCKVDGGKLYARYDAKQLPTQPSPDGRSLPKVTAPKAPPEGFVPAQDPDPVTGHWPGWVLVQDQPQYKWHREAWESGCDSADEQFKDGQTYELCGPKVGGNPERFNRHVLIPHGNIQMLDCPRDFDGIKEYLATRDIEGIVWHHPDGRMVKVKAKDFGISRALPTKPPTEEDA